ncbi:MAG: MBOAT family protein [Deltaproteobacteria bacterium]|nr:MBOAT family protein [Deltaproteobacteria bacterium]
MLFVSFTFLFFFPVVLAVRWLAPRRLAAPWLLLASYVFYMSWGPVYGLLLGGATAASFALGLAMDRWRSHRKTFLVLGAAGALGTLAFFKYAGFLATQGWNVARLFGWKGPVPELDIVLPLGISFYLFETISYLADVYKGRPAERSIVNYGLFVAFFPHLVAGPILRVTEIVPQFRDCPPFDAGRFEEGLGLTLRGCIKKAVLADNLAVWSDQVFRAHQGASTLGLWVGVLAYTGQIYCDFSGYTDMARGCAKMLGYDLPDNFLLPYLSSSPTDFWRRWHMTLSRWLRDYLYITLGGSRRGRARTYVNLLVTMALGGLWHGAAWKFVAWGVYHGLLLAAHRAFGELWSGARAAAVRASHAYRALAIMATFFAVMIGWVFFRAANLGDALEIIAGLFRYKAHVKTPEEMRVAVCMLLALATGHALGSRRLFEKAYGLLPGAVRGLALAAMVAAIYLFATSTGAFIYFQF